MSEHEKAGFRSVVPVAAFADMLATAAAAAAYEELFEFEIDDRLPFPYFVLRLDGQQLYLGQRPSVALGHGGHEIVIASPEIDARFQRQRKAGASFVSEIATTERGREFVASDPNGYRIRFIESNETAISPVFATGDMDATLEFYSNVIGFEVDPNCRSASWTRLLADGFPAYVSHRPDLAAAAKGQEVMIWAPRIDGRYDRHRANGANIVCDIKDTLEFREYTIEDPNGYNLHFYASKWGLPPLRKL